jgi:hypothetical protein
VSYLSQIRGCLTQLSKEAIRVSILKYKERWNSGSRTESTVSVFGGIESPTSGESFNSAQHNQVQKPFDIFKEHGVLQAPMMLVNHVQRIVLEGINILCENELELSRDHQKSLCSL